MGMFTLHRNFILRTNKGHSIQFVKGVPTRVPPMCETDVIAIGAVPLEEVDVIPAETKPKVELTPQQREEALFKAFDTLVARNDRGDFTASNQPHCKKLAHITDFEVSIAERDEAWQKYKAEKNMVDEAA